VEKINWSAFEYEYHKKSADWFWVVWIVSVGIIATSLIFGSVSFAILIFIISFTISVQAVRKPKKINIEVNEKGIEIYNKKYLFADLDSYWIKTDDSFPRMLLKSKKKISRFITIPLDINIANEVDEFLSEYLEKEELEEPLLYLFTKFF